MKIYKNLKLIQN